MATTWIDLVGYVRFRYEIFQQTDRTLRFHLPTSEGRTQRVAVHHVPGESDGPGWILIESAVASADGVDLRRLLELAGESEIGGVVIADGVVLFRHAAALGDLSLAGFDKPFQLVAARADELEHALT
ncbi:MAG TPA: hypothetical protein VH008_10065, partial [Pseudonocardia sp.]|nr:hypothetical protein [Pseudonocardia sp.]